jgi:two-component system, response regulator YesN
MLKVILIDDESIILKGLYKLIDWHFLGYEIVGEATDGAEGLRLIEELKPDVVISDIAMPNLSGIDMLKQIYEKGINVKTIFLSGYQEFSYAREAVRYGAVDYLLKPVSEKDLTKVMERVTSLILSEHSVHVLRKKDSKSEILFQDIVVNHKYQKNLKEIVNLLKMDIGKEGMVCIGIKILFKKDVVNSEENLGLMKFEIYEFIQGYLEKIHLGGILKKDYNACYCILTENSDRSIMQTNIGILENKVKSHYPVELMIGAGAWSDMGGKLNHLYMTAKFALELYYFQEQRYIDYEDINKDYVHSLDEYQEKVKLLKSDLITNKKSELLLEEVEECIRLLGNIHFGNKNAVINSCILLAGEIFSTLLSLGLLDDSNKEEQEEFLEDIRKKVTLTSLIKLFLEFYNQVFLRIRLLQKHRESSEIIRVKNYIKEHFKENISLEEIADYIGMNATYMSVFFKKETGQNFKAYLTEIRMMEAIRLLNSTDMKSYELAAAVGYKDDKQFREKFKEIYGVSPQQYRKQISRQ